jgi:hypothetical protein
MSETEDRFNNFDEDMINKLYDTAMAIRNENHDNPNNKTIFSSVNKRMAVTDAAMHIAYILTELKDKVLVVNLDSRSTRQWKSISLKSKTEFVYEFKKFDVFK